MAGLPEALALTAISAVLPGLAQLRTGRIRTGGAMLIGYALAIAAAGIVAGGHRQTLVALAVRPAWLLALSGAAVAVAALWGALLVRSYMVLCPDRLSPPAQLAGGTAVAVMCLLVIVPPLTVARYGYLQRDLITDVFHDEPAGAALARPGPPVSALRQSWSGLPRLNILLIGADADTGRPGIRTDSMTVASIDTRTGDTTLLGLPRNLQRVPVWDGRGRVPFAPEELLNAVYQYGTAHPYLLHSKVRNPGAELLKRTTGHVLGLPVHYYAMVHMRAFRKIVEAMGGVRVCVGRSVPVPREQVPAGVIGPGCRRLSGREALWYGRSRTGSSDYGRMTRQKCLLWAIARQARPFTVLRSFQKLAGAFKDSVSTDIPRGLLPPLVALSGKVRRAHVLSVQFIPPAVSPGRPDYSRIRALAARAIKDAGSPREHADEVHILRKTCA